VTAAPLRFRCPCCGQWHEGLPDVTFRAPYHWRNALAEDDPERNNLDTDLCVIDLRDFFIRCVLEVPIRGTESSFGWGVWVTHSEANFKDYVAHFRDPPQRAAFGYLANRLSGYPDTVNLRTLVHWQPGNQRPLVEVEPSDHPLSRDQREGITLDQAIEFARPVLHPDPPPAEGTASTP
jgi:hypothetical protein